MTEDKKRFTQGGWAVGSHSNKVGIPSINIKSLVDGCHVALVSSRDKENEANANLIAAAPLMYEALLEVRKWLEVELSAKDTEAYKFVTKALSYAEEGR